MKKIILLTIFFFIQGCSFDDKSGIWNNDNTVIKKKDKTFKDFETLVTSEKIFDKIIPIQNDYNFTSGPIKKNSKWHDELYNSSNNFDNFSYNEINELIFKSRKITRHLPNRSFLFNKNNIILSDEKGNIIVYSLIDKKIKIKFNFYQKKFKNIKKDLNMVIQNDIIYVSDNLGYLYALDFNSNIILWAKNYKIPFRSNIKIIDNKIITANQNNILFFFDIKNGETLQSIPTEENILNNEFINNISFEKPNIFFLNTFGSLYSVDKNTMRIKWFLNLNQFTDLNPSNLFEGNQIIVKENKLIVSSNKFLYIINSSNGLILFKKNFKLSVKPIALGDHLFLITENNLLICMNLESGNIIYSYNINDKISKFLNLKKKKVEFNSLFIANNKILIFLKNSYVLKFSFFGNIEDIFKLPTKLNSNPVFVNDTFLYLDKNNKLSVVN